MIRNIKEPSESLPNVISHDIQTRTPSNSDIAITTSEPRSLENELFSMEPWKCLPRNRCGTDALKDRLIEIFHRHIQEAFPPILDTIRNRKVSTRTHLNTLEVSRTTTAEKKAYLMDLSQRLHSLNCQVLRGKYQGINDESLKLRKLIREINDSFTTRMINYGHCVPFLDTSIVQLPGTERMDEQTKNMTTFSGCVHGGTWTIPLDGPVGFNTGKMGSGIEVPCTRWITRLPMYRERDSSITPVHLLHYLHICMTPSFQRFSQEELRLSDYLYDTIISKGTSTASVSLTDTRQSQSASRVGFGHARTSSKPILAPSTQENSMLEGRVSSKVLIRQIYTWIREEIRDCRGTELPGTLNPEVLPVLFRRQIAHWDKLATDHFQSIVESTNATLAQAALTVLKNKTLAQKVQKLIQDVSKPGKERGLSQLHQRFEEIVSRHLQTQSPIFEKNLRDARLARFRAGLQRYQHNHPSASAPSGSDTSLLSLMDMSSLFHELHMSNPRNLEDDVHDTLKCYYELARHDFVEFVTQQVIESYLNDPEGPVLFFNPGYIGSLSENVIDDLGAEDPVMVRTRSEKEETLSKLEEAEQIVLKHM
ncbi:MAG: hypothetical protein Q9219_001644 [cf. Caloplaca sp. 3 TL-2023]